jgi:uncharacterized protein YceH (UPF0502 family)
MYSSGSAEKTSAEPRYHIPMHLSLTEARVLGCLIEKEITAPDYYPLTLNATVNACNQKSSREPVMELSEADVRTALFDLEGIGLVRTVSDSRVPKFEHRVRDVLNLRRDEVALLCLLLLRDPQTPAELRMRTERMYTFDDNAAVLSTLERLAARPEPLTFLMQRQPGAREARWSHLLAGPINEALLAPSAASPVAPAPAPAIAQRIAELEARVLSLEERLAELEARPA